MLYVFNGVETSKVVTHQSTEAYIQHFLVIFSPEIERQRTAYSKGIWYVIAKSLKFPTLKADNCLHWLTSHYSLLHVDHMKINFVVGNVL